MTGTGVLAALIGDPSDVITITFGGKTFRAGRRTAAHLVWTQQQLDKLHPGCRLVVIQPCYNTGVPESEGTHDKDRVLDVSIVGLDWWDAQRFLRAHGWAAWVRFPPAFGWHIHMISLAGTGPVGIFVPGQIDDYYRHTLGLKDQHNTDLDKSWFPGDDGPAPWPVGTPEQWHRDIDATLNDFALWERELEDDMFEKADSERLKNVEKTLIQLTKDSRRRNTAEISRTRRVIKKVTGIDADLERIEKALAEDDGEQ